MMTKGQLLAVVALATAMPAAAQMAPPPPSPPPAVGGTTDSFGCLPAAGYTHSRLRQACLRLFEAGVRLDPVKPEGSAVVSAFAVFKGSETTGPVEIFLPGRDGSVLMRPVPGKGASWRAAGLRLRLAHGRLILRGGGVLYQGPVAR